MKDLKNDKYKQIAVALLILLGILIIPILHVGIYAHPCADDYSYGLYTHEAWMTTHSLGATLKAAIAQVNESYHIWQGTFSSIFLMSLSPAIWGEGGYFITTFIMVGMLIASHFYLGYVILIKMIKSQKSYWLIISSVVSLLMIQTVCSPVNAFYWFNGSVHYTFMHSCMIFLFGFILHMNEENKKGKEIALCVIACLFAILCGGSNYVTGLLGILGCAVLTGFKWAKRKKAIWYFLPIIVFGICFYINISAPGNEIRQAKLYKNTPINAIIESFEAGNSYMMDWMSIPIVLFMLAMIPVLWKVTEKLKYKLWLPICMLLVSYCSVACMFTPGCYAMNSTATERILNIIKFWFVLVLILNEGCWVGYVKQIIKKKETKFKLDIRIYAGIILLALMVVFVADDENRVYDWNSYGAFCALRNREPQQYHQAYLARVELLESNAMYVELPDLWMKPRLLFFTDITEDPNDWRNAAMAEWYNKEWVALE